MYNDPKNHMPEDLTKVLWYVERENQRIAGLADPQYADMFWTSYRLVPLTDDPTLLNELQSDEFWNQCDGVIFFRAAATGMLAPLAFPGGSPAQRLRDTGRIWMRALYPEDAIAKWKRKAERKRHSALTVLLRRLRIAARQWRRKRPRYE